MNKTGYFSLAPRRLISTNIHVRIICILSLLSIMVTTGYAYGDPYDDVMKELKRMSSRINELEGLVESQQDELSILKEIQEEDTTLNEISNGTGSEGNSEVLETRLSSFKDELIESVLGKQSPLKISGFFDFTVQDMDEGTQDIVGTQRERNKPFDFGSFEMDLQYSYGDHYSVSAALVWDSGSTPTLNVGLVDYHLFDDDAPARGRIFDEAGFHLQVGRFDIPYGVDYQYFPSVNRPNVSAPMTTTRIQNGGYGSDGMRIYGTWKTFDYTAYAVNALYGNNGGVLGGRIGFFPGRNPYRLHRFSSPRTVEFGFSYLKELDKEFDTREKVYGFDFTLNYNMFTLVAEWMKRDSEVAFVNSSGGLVHGKDQDESGFHVSLVTDLEKVVKRPIYLFTRFDAWNPNTDAILSTKTSLSGTTTTTNSTAIVPVENLKRLTFGLGYNLTKSLGLKLEYADYQGQGTKETSFEDSTVTFQLTARY